ncbi:MAG TPA: hypothetical protein VFD26_04215 [Methyloceanibacter sp.]|nr:hypothetical protein [Methyloceanibacter sp.]
MKERDQTAAAAKSAEARAQVNAGEKTDIAAVSGDVFAPRSRKERKGEKATN